MFDICVMDKTQLEKVQRSWWPWSKTLHKFSDIPTWDNAFTSC